MDEQAKKVALRKIPYGVFVVGVKQGDDLNAFTVTWLSQCSFQPPLIMMAVRVGSASHDMIREGGVFVVNILGKDQKALGERFFKRVPRVGNKLGEVAFRTGVTGAPILEEAIAYLECKVCHFVESGDHNVAIGEVVEAGVREDVEPLILSETGWHYGG